MTGSPLMVERELVGAALERETVTVKLERERERADAEEDEDDGVISYDISLFFFSKTFCNFSQNVSRFLFLSA